MFYITAIFGLVCLILASIGCTLGVVNSGSSTYLSNPRVQTAWISFGVGSVIGWFSVMGFIMILIIGALLGGFKPLEKYTTISIKESTIFTLEDNPKIPYTAKDLSSVYRIEDYLMMGNVVSLIILIMLVMITMLLLVIGIIASVAVSEIGSIDSQFKDTNLNSAYTWGIITAVFSFLGIILMIVAMTGYGIYMKPLIY